MDRIERTINIVKRIYDYKSKRITQEEFIFYVCDYFDNIKEDELNDNDLNFLLYLSNLCGIPLYYKMLVTQYQNNKKIKNENTSLLGLSSIINESYLSHDDVTLNKYQKEIYDRFKHDVTNRYVLTAPTSFGKSFLVIEIIRKMKYKNVLLIYPSLSLLSENYEKILSDKRFNTYSLITLSNTEINTENDNIFIFTPERYLSFVDKNHSIKFDFAFIDEVYKIDKEFDDAENGNDYSNERDISYRFALNRLCMYSKDILLAGPYMNISNQNNNSFDIFCKKMGLMYLNYNKYNVVNKKEYFVDGKTLIEGKEIKFSKKDAIYKKVYKTLNAFDNDGTIIYCSRKYLAENNVEKIINTYSDSKIFKHDNNSLANEAYVKLLKHIKNKYSDEWIVYKALKYRIGIHHGLIPKYIQKEIIDLFNKNVIKYIFSTTTITEGINTSAKNIIITKNNVANKNLKYF